MINFLLKIFFGRKVKKLLKTAAEEMKDDPELQKSVSDLAYHHNRLTKLQDDFCKRFPDSERCKNN